MLGHLRHLLSGRAQVVLRATSCQINASRFGVLRQTVVHRVLAILSTMDRDREKEKPATSYRQIEIELNVGIKAARDMGIETAGDRDKVTPWMGRDETKHKLRYRDTHSSSGRI